MRMCKFDSSCTVTCVSWRNAQLANKGISVKFKPVSRMQ